MLDLIFLLDNYIVILFEDINAVQRDDLIRELSPEAVEYFTSIRLGDDWDRVDRVYDSLKFVRLGVGEAAKIVLGAAIKYGPEEHIGNRVTRKSVRHRDLLDFTLEQMSQDEMDAIRSTVNGRAILREDRSGLLLDAGRLMILSDGPEPPDVLLYEKSLDFDRADPAGREETCALVQTLLSPLECRVKSF